MPPDDSSPNLVEIAIEARSPDDRARLADAVDSLTHAEVSTRIVTDPESGQTIIGGQSVPQLENIIDQLRNEFGVTCNVGQPHVAYRETMSRAATVSYTHRRATAEPPEYAAVTIRFEPVDMRSDFEFNCEPKSGVIAPEIASAVERGLLSVADSGLIAGFPMIGLKATLVSAEARDGDAPMSAFETAGRAAFRQAKDDTAPLLLEPVMHVTVTLSREDHEAVLANIKLRRGSVRTVDRQFGQTVIKAEVPLANLLGYERALDVALQGRAHAEIRFLRYAPIPSEPASPDDHFPAAAALRA